MDIKMKKLGLGAFFNDRNFRHLSGKYPHAYGNIATTKLIQCGIAGKAENKAFHGIGKVGCWILVSVAVKWNQSYLVLCTSF